MSVYPGDSMALLAPYADGAHLALQVEACVRTMAHEVAVKKVCQSHFYVGGFNIAATPVPTTFTTWMAT